MARPVPRRRAKERREPDAGRYLKRWALDAGLKDIRISSSIWTFADPESCEWWGNLWADRCEFSALGDQAVDYGLATREDIAEIAAAWRARSVQPDAVFFVPHGELLARP